MATIESGHYETARRTLVEDPIVRDLARDLQGADLTHLTHADGTPRFQFMQSANREYAKRGGTNQAHIGAVAETIIRILTTATK